MHIKTFPFSRLLLAAVFLTIMIVGCDKNDDKQPTTAPVVATAALTNITSSGATAGGSIVSDGGATITASGVVWSETNAMPTLADSVVAGTTATGTFTSEIAGLEFERSYYVRGFATNSVGTGYGEVVILNTTTDTNKVRFTYNGEEVVYGIIVSPTTGNRWLDRNLGAKQVATSHDDYLAYGDLFQWGRPADGHQLVNWTSSTEGIPANGMTSEKASSDSPNHSDFIFLADPANEANYDWRDDNNSNRWVTVPQGPCPEGWHVPALSEWMSEVSSSEGGTATSGGMKDRTTGYNLLKLTTPGARLSDEGPSVVILGKGSHGHYWSNTEYFYGAISAANEVSPGADYIQTNGFIKSYAMSVRCVKD